MQDRYQSHQRYQYKDTRELVDSVNKAAELVRLKGEAAFSDFRTPGSQWRKYEAYIFVLDTNGNMVVHPDPELESKNQLDLKDINGKPIIRGLIEAVTAFSDKPEGWYHYQWPVPGGLLPRWKSSYVRLVQAPQGNDYIVGSGIYNDRMERDFAVDMVNQAAEEIDKKGAAAFRLFHDPAGPFLVKDVYIFVFDMKGIDLVNPAFPNLEGRNLLNLKDSRGKHIVHEMYGVVKTKGSGWVVYMWPKPGESVSTEKSAYVTKVKMGDKWVLVGCGVYLADAPTMAPASRKMTAQELMALVREAAAVFEECGEQAYAEFRQKGSRWLHDETYFFVWAMDGCRLFHAADPAGEGVNVRGMKDITGKPFGEMIISAAESSSGEGWVHYMYPEPGDIFPAWKSTFINRVTFPSGEPHIIGCGIYNMQMDKAFIEDIVNRGADLVEEQGKKAFALLRDKTGPFVFMDTYVFVNSLDGVELVNPVFPSLEGKNLIGLKDLTGKEVIKDEIAAVKEQDSAWLDLNWYKPGDNTPALKHTFVRKVQSVDGAYIVGAGIYLKE
jgi:signal transduction histidine kinase